MQSQSFGMSHPGMIRKENEDHFLNDDQEGLYLVADGLGGYARGDVASRMAVESIAAFIRNSRKEGIPWPIRPQRRYGMEENRFLAAIFLANGDIFHEFQEMAHTSPMGTTLTGILVDGEGLVIANIGDSRVYRFRNHELDLLTCDHSLVMEEVKQGRLTYEQARIHPQKHIITRALGISEPVEADLSTADPLPGDLYLLCSDGLSDMLSHGEILRLIREGRMGPLKELGKDLVDAANAAGGSDNITVVLVRFTPE